MRRLSIALAVLFMVGAAGTALAQSKCDAGVTKATGKKVSCKCGVIAKGFAKATPPDVAKLMKCQDKFTAKCSKAQTAGDCVVQPATDCGKKETEVDTFVASFCAGSPSGAFLE